MEAYKPKDVFNPGYQRMYQCIAYRAMNPLDDKLPPVDPRFVAGVLPLPELVEKAEPCLKKIKESFEIVKNESTKESNRDRFRRNLGQAAEIERDLESRVGANGVKREAPEEMNLAAISEQMIDNVSSANPVADFQAMIRRRDVDLVETAIDQMIKIITDLVRQSFGSQFYPKALSALKALRKGCMEQSESNKYNRWLMEFKNELLGVGDGGASQGNGTGGFPAFWDLMKEERGDVGLISSDEAGESEVSKVQGEKFFEEERAAAPVAAPVEEENDDDLVLPRPSPAAYLPKWGYREAVPTNPSNSSSNCTKPALYAKVNQLDAPCNCTNQTQSQLNQTTINQKQSQLDQTTNEANNQTCLIPESEDFDELVAPPASLTNGTDPEYIDTDTNQKNDTYINPNNLLANKMLLIIGDSQDRRALDQACKRIPTDTPGKFGDLYLTDIFGRILKTERPIKFGEVSFCVIQRDGATYLLVGLYHLGVEMAAMFDPTDPIGYEGRPTDGVFWQRTLTRVRIFPYVLYSVAKEVFPGLVEKWGGNLTELPDSKYKVEWTPDEIEAIKLRASQGDQLAQEDVAKFGLNLDPADRPVWTPDEDMISKVIGWPTRHRHLPFWYPSPVMIIAGSSLWDVWNYNRGGLNNETSHIQRLRSGGWERSLVSELVEPVYEIFPGVPLCLRTTPIPISYHSPTEIAAFNEVAREVGKHLGMRVIDWGAKKMGYDDGFHADNRGQVIYLNLILRELGLWNLARIEESCPID
ncbi:X-ray repair cross-complementing protein 5 [Blyttiomyces sp. JEL0837]|nr:X-ray repair cross-complementing protein 5 [Blyttiomyces sp. JEL0837]